LRTIRKEHVLIKRFASDEGILKLLDVVQVCVKGKTKNINTYIEALCVPLVCSKLEEQSIEHFDLQKYKYLYDLQLADENVSEKSVDILIGLDYYYTLISGKTIRGRGGHRRLCPPL